MPYMIVKRDTDDRVVLGYVGKSPLGLPSLRITGINMPRYGTVFENKHSNKGMLVRPLRKHTREWTFRGEFSLDPGGAFDSFAVNLMIKMASSSTTEVDLVYVKIAKGRVIQFRLVGAYNLADFQPRITAATGGIPRAGQYTLKLTELGIENDS